MFIITYFLRHRRSAVRGYVRERQLPKAETNEASLQKRSIPQTAFRRSVLNDPRAPGTQEHFRSLTPFVRPHRLYAIRYEVFILSRKSRMQ